MITSQSVSLQKKRMAFIILMNGRCGSSLLVSYLNQIPDLLCYPEILHNFSADTQQEILFSFINGYEPVIPGISATGYSGVPDEEKNVDDIVACGTKVKWGDLGELDSFLSICRNNGVKLFYMTRTNILRSALSRYQAIKFSEVYGDYNKTLDNQKLPPIEIDIVQFEQLLAQEEYFYHALNDIIGRYGVAVPGLTYEQLIVKPVESINLFLEQLASNYRVLPDIRGSKDELLIAYAHNGGIVSPLRQRVLKMTPQDFSSIANRAEFLEYVRNGKFADMLDA